MSEKDTRYGAGSWTRSIHPTAKYPPEIYGRMRLSMPSPVFVSIVHQQRVVATQEIGPGQDRVRFVLDPRSKLLQPGAVRLRLIDAQTLQPLANGRVVAPLGSAMKMERTGPDGSCRCECQAGLIGLGVSHPDYGSAELVMRIEPGVETDLGDVAIWRAVSISGVMVDEHAKPIVGNLRFDSLDRPAAAQGGARRIVTAKSDGSSYIARLSRRRYLLQFETRGTEFGRCALEVDARSGSVEGARRRDARADGRLLPPHVDPEAAEVASAVGGQTRPARGEGRKRRAKVLDTQLGCLGADGRAELAC